MLPSAHRMRRSDDFRIAVRSGLRAARPTLVLHLAPGDPADPVLVGVVVSRTVGGAVTRNAVRRRLRPLLRERIERVPAGSRLVVRALPPAAAASTAGLATDLDAGLDRALRQVAATGAGR